MLHAPRIRRVPERAGGFALCWIGAPSGSAWRHRPLKLAFGFKCAFRPTVIKGLDGAEIVGIKFQQIQKYETGANRVSASRLWGIVEALGAPAAHFFDGIEQSVPLETVKEPRQSKLLLIL